MNVPSLIGWQTGGNSSKFDSAVHCNTSFAFGPQDGFREGHLVARGPGCSCWAGMCCDSECWLCQLSGNRFISVLRQEEAV